MRNLASDFTWLLSNAEKYHSLFYHLIRMGRPSFSDLIDTACVRFNKTGDCIDFLFNEKFYHSLSDYDLMTIVCHEALHIVLNHGKRLLAKEKRDQANIAMDIVVNHLLTDSFGFERDKISMQKDMCWIDTVFPNDPTVVKDQSSEYYFDLLNNNAHVKANMLDDHGGWMFGDDWSKVLNELGSKLSNEEKQSLAKALQKELNSDSNKESGNIAAGWLYHIKPFVFKRNKKWETVIQEWALPFIHGYKDEEQWVRINRRFAALSEDLLIPTEMEELDLSEKHRIKVVFFLDTSGSCWHLKDRFFHAAASLPPERFIVQLRTFDTEVYETDLESRKIYGGGGTSFSILEDYIQKQIKKERKTESKNSMDMKDGSNYPFVFIITDGFGDEIRPEKPENWHWFLSENYKEYIPEKSHVFLLKDFE